MFSNDDRAEAELMFENYPETACTRLWKQLCKNLPVDCRATVNGRCCILHDKSGVLLATKVIVFYAVRVPETKIRDATRLGLRQSQYWSGIGKTDDLRVQFGSCWFFGNMLEAELDFINECYSDFDTYPDLR